MAKNEVIYESRRKQKEARLPIVAELYSRGFSYSKIREEVMRRLSLDTYSKATVKKDIEALLKEWRAARQTDMEDALELALERNRQHYNEVRDEWDRSKEDRTVTDTKRKGIPVKAEPKKIGFHTGADEGEEKTSIKTVSRETKTKTIAGEGDPAYMELMIRLEDQRAKLLGLYAPERKEISGKDGEPLFTSFGDLDLSKLTEEEKAALLELARKCNK